MLTSFCSYLQTLEGLPRTNTLAYYWNRKLLKNYIYIYTHTHTHTRHFVADATLTINGTITTSTQETWTGSTRNLSLLTTLTSAYGSASTSLVTTEQPKTFQHDGKILEQFFFQNLLLLLMKYGKCWNKDKYLSKNGATTLSITTFSITTLSLMTFSMIINKTRHSS